jgi:23S rRNA pseudouridine2457 synthase
MSVKGHRYFIINKPRDMVSQFISSHEVRKLDELGFEFPEGTHPIGRLDKDSEGLLILTTNKKVTRLLFQGEIPHKRTYLVRVKYTVSPESLAQLRTGISIRVHGGGYFTTTPCEAEIVQGPEGLCVNKYDVNVYVPCTWLLISLTEGKFHQIRKMVKEIKHPCVDLIRVNIEELALGELAVGGVREIGEEDFFEMLKIADWRA